MTSRRGEQFSVCTARHRFGSLADIEARIGDVRFAPKSGHAHRRHQCLLSAKSGQIRLLPADPHAGLTADAFDIVADGHVNLGISASATVSTVNPAPVKVISVRISGLPSPTHIEALTPGMKLASNSSRTAPSNLVQCRMSPLRVSMIYSRSAARRPALSRCLQALAP